MLRTLRTLSFLSLCISVLACAYIHCDTKELENYVQTLFKSFHDLVQEIKCSSLTNNRMFD